MPWEIGLEIPELLDINVDDDGGNDFPCVQLLNNDGTPLRLGVINGITNLGIVTYADADVQPSGSIRIADWDYLSSGNIVIVGDSRQAADQAMTGQAGGNVPVYRVVTPGGLQVHAYTNVSSEPVAGSISKSGVGVTASGFAIRWQDAGLGSTIRLFDNAGNPTTTNISLAALTGNDALTAGGDGSGCGFHGNGIDAYVFVNSAGTPSTPWVTVLNADGTVRWSRTVQDDGDPIDNTGATDVDGAIDQYGRVITVFSSLLPTSSDPNVLVRYIQARLFSKDGVPLGPRFVVSEWENPANAEALYDSTGPRVAWRGNQVAICWLGGDAPTVMATTPSYKVLAARMFTVPVYDDFNDGNDTTPLPKWAHYDPLGGLTAAPATFSVADGHYQIVAPAPQVPDAGPARAGSFLDGVVYDQFYVAADLIDFDDTVRQAFGIAARINTPGLGTMGGYLFSWEPGSGTLPGTDNGDLDISRLVAETPIGQIETAPSGLHLTRGKSYRFVFMGNGTNFEGQVYELPNTTTPLIRLPANDPDDMYPSGLVGLVVASQGDYDVTGDATWDNFLATTAEPRIATSLSGGTVTLSWPLVPFNLLSSPSLSAPSWSPVTTGISQVGNQFQYVIPAGAQKFYRLSYP